MIVREYIRQDIQKRVAALDDESLWDFWMQLYKEDETAIPIKGICQWCEETHGECDLDTTGYCTADHATEWCDSEAEVKA